MPSSDQASQISQPSIARASSGGGRPCCDVARGAGSDGSPMEGTSDRLPSQCVPTGDAGQSISDPAKSPVPPPAHGLHKYDNRVVPFRSQQGATGIGTSAASTFQQSDEIRLGGTSSLRVKVNVR